MVRILLILLLTIQVFAQDPFEYYTKNGTLLSLEASSNAVVFSPYTPVITIATDSTNLASTNSTTFTDFISTGNQTRVRQGYGFANDILTQAQLYIGDYTAITFAQIRVWRRNQLTGTFTMIGSARITPTANGTQTFIISIPNVREGDFIGVRLKTTASALNIRSGNSNLTVYKKDNSDSTAVTFSTTVANSYIPIIVSGRAPVIVAYGNSLTGGSSNHYPYTYATQIAQIDRIDWTFPYNAFSQYGITYQNMGKPGDASDVLLSGILTDVVNLRPVLCALEIPTNDLNGSIAATSIANMEAIVDILVSNNIKVALIKIPPKGATNAKMFMRDTINNALSTYVLNRNGIVIDLDTVLGVERVGGSPTPPVGNYWDIKTGWSGDAIHFTDFAYHWWGQSVYNKLRQYYTITDTSLITVSDSTVVSDTSYTSPKTFYANVYNFWKRPDSVVIIYNLNHGTDSRSSMTFVDSLGVTNTCRYTKSLSISGTDQDSVFYSITAYANGKTGTSTAKSFKLRVIPPVADYRTGLIYDWFADSNTTANSSLATWQNTIDTLTQRQSTAGDKPVHVSNQKNGYGVVRYATSDRMLFTNIALTNFTVAVVFKSRVNTDNYLIASSGAGVFVSLTAAGSGLGSYDGTRLRSATTSGIDTNWHIAIFTNDKIFVDGVEKSYAVSQTLLSLDLTEMGGRIASGFYFTGDVAELRIYNANLSDVNKLVVSAKLNNIFAVY